MKVIVDTSVWIRYLRQNSSDVFELLEKDLVLVHTKVLGEMACGSIKNRSKILSDLSLLSIAEAVSDKECLEFIESEHLHGHGLSFIDVHLLASARLMKCQILTDDKKLSKIAHMLLT